MELPGIEAVVAVVAVQPNSGHVPDTGTSCYWLMAIPFPLSLAPFAGHIPATAQKQGPPADKKVRDYSGNPLPACVKHGFVMVVGNLYEENMGRGFGRKPRAFAGRYGSYWGVREACKSEIRKPS